MRKIKILELPDPMTCSTCIHNYYDIDGTLSQIKFHVMITSIVGTELEILNTWHAVAYKKLHHKRWKRFPKFKNKDLYGKLNK